ncbi:MAG: dockerin type I domain-containing protein, partial [Planctomycetota bacterium]
NGTTLTLNLPTFKPGDFTLTLSAKDPGNPALLQSVDVFVADTPDPPTVANPLGVVESDENQDVLIDLTNVFNDPDGDALTYVITSVGGAAVVAGQPFPTNDVVSGIDFDGATMRIQLNPNSTGDVPITVRASDGSFPISDSFTLRVVSVPDAPIATPDGYNVPVGSTLEIIDPGNGLLRNDTDLDGDSLSIVPGSVTSTSLGNLTVNANGTFTYENTSGQSGDTDSFQYQVVDSTGLVSETVDVTLTLSQSRFQNPIAGENFDVTADGFVTALDALRVINLLNRQSSGSTGGIPISELGFTPPDYVDVNGDGSITALDALLVINRLNRQNNSFGGEGEAPSAAVSAAVSTSYATVTPNLPSRIVEMPGALDADPEDRSTSIEVDGERRETNATDTVLAGFVDVDASRSESIAESMPEDGGSASSQDIDQALSSFLDEPLL